MKFGNICDVYMVMCDFFGNVVWMNELCNDRVLVKLCMLSSVFLVCSNIMELWQWIECG